MHRRRKRPRKAQQGRHGKEGSATASRHGELLRSGDRGLCAEGTDRGGSPTEEGEVGMHLGGGGSDITFSPSSRWPGL